MKSETSGCESLSDRMVALLASQHGVDVNSIIPGTKPERLATLRSILDRTNVPFPICRKKALSYFELAANGVPFKIGELNDQTVDLGGYEDQQVYEALTMEDHLSWACLVSDQCTTKRQFACEEYLLGEWHFEIGGSVIPDYYNLNARIYQQTGWQLAAVSEIIPAEVFFHCHSRKFFPVTTFMRPPGTDYLAEPDIGHDVAGHVATFTIPQVALVMNNHGLAHDMIIGEAEQTLRSANSEADIAKIQSAAKELLYYAGRLYWFTVEFGLVMQQGRLKVFGAGILSSPGETRHSVESLESNRILIDPANDRDLLRLATTDYLISEFQKTYFVMKNFESLASLTPERILQTAKLAQNLPHHTWREIVPGDQVLNVGTAMTSPNEKYYRLLATQSLDQCLYRTAVRNLRLHVRGIQTHNHTEKEFVSSLPVVPEKLIGSFVKADQRGEFASNVPSGRY